MAVSLAFIALALLLLFLGAESRVRGSASLALRAGLSPLVVGLTIVSFATSSPELVVTLQAAQAGQGDIAVGSVVGSNSLNIAVILGVTALLCPIPVHRQIVRRDAPIALAGALLLPALLLDRGLGRGDGALLFAGILGYTWLNVALARRQAQRDPQAGGDASLQRISRHWGLDVALGGGGLGALVLGSRLLVEHAVALARTFDVSEAVIGLTIVAVGTSMPELATSVVAAARKQPDIAIGNVVGSCIFNSFGILGLAAIVSPLRAPGVSPLDLGAMLLFTALLVPLLYTGRLLLRLEGALLLGLYGIYLFLLWPR